MVNRVFTVFLNDILLNILVIADTRHCADLCCVAKAVSLTAYAWQNIYSAGVFLLFALFGLDRWLFCFALGFFSYLL